MSRVKAAGEFRCRRRTGSWLTEDHTETNGLQLFKASDQYTAAAIRERILSAPGGWCAGSFQAGDAALERNDMLRWLANAAPGDVDNEPVAGSGRPRKS